MHAHQDPPIRLVAQGPAWSGPGETSDVIHPTRRERAVLRLLVARYTDRAIAAALSISDRTVTTHVARICAKLGVHSRREVAGREIALDDNG